MKRILFLAAAVAIGFTSCKKDDPETPDHGDDHEEELITTLIYTLTSANDTAVFTFRDVDGDGGNPPEITEDSLLANTMYTGSVTLLNESETPAEDITEEIEEEAEEHQFFYQLSGTNVTIAYDDVDADGNPVGLLTTVQADSSGHNNLTVTLRHEPNKDAAGVSDGDITNAGGETDIEVMFHFHVK
jgi:hypothetical protein